MSVEDLFPDWPRPPYEGFTAEDLFRMPDLPPHTQMIDGSFVFRSRQSCFHSVTNCLLETGLSRAAPAHLDVVREMVVVLGRRQAPEPDIAVIHAGGDRGPSVDRYYARDVVLAVETVSPDSEERDRGRKPQLYAEAGIEHFWRVEMDGSDDRPVVHVHERDRVAGVYELTGVHRACLRLAVPFDIDIDLTEIDRL
ncbi:Uma2 family endonuclease [Streptomyces roseoverticillatus]|uniref:Uma2 family endonuclease n=1 Tax=Streptomyces roseoverticillatus TaxID=66429 RepID=UPI001F263647|nr:Uma2 family endonuclease [Streptomyces roseoverticillatus]MCF3103900.1 Uma2 family endonuclease [Streptomyces roseoverticillatus]